MLASKPRSENTITDRTGAIQVRSEYQPRDDRFSVVLKDRSSWRTLHEFENCGPLSLVSLNAEATGVLLLGRGCGDDRRKLWSLPFDGGAIRAVVDDATLEVEDVIFDPFDDRPIGVTLGGSEQPARWLDEKTQRRMATLSRVLKSSRVEIRSRSADEQKLVVYADDGRRPPIYYLVDVELLFCRNPFVQQFEGQLS